MYIYIQYLPIDPILAYPVTKEVRASIAVTYVCVSSTVAVLVVTLQLLAVLATVVVTEVETAT